MLTCLCLTLRRVFVCLTSSSMLCLTIPLTLLKAYLILFLVLCPHKQIIVQLEQAKASFDGLPF